MKIFKKSDYKGKWFVLCDSVDPEDFEIGEIREDEITDGFLQAHVEASRYYGIPAYNGNDEKLKRRINSVNMLLDVLEDEKNILGTQQVHD